MKIEIQIDPAIREDVEAALINWGAESFSFAEVKFQTDDGDIFPLKKLTVQASFIDGNRLNAALFLASISTDPDRAAQFKLLWGGDA